MGAIPEMKPTIGNIIDTGKPLEIDIKRLLTTRMLVQASSGGGKSYALRRILEQTANHVQQVILDIEDEFITLREKYDYIVCAPSGADAVATPQTATLLARRLRETRASAIIGMYEMKMQDRKRFVRLFLEEFVEAPKSMWHPCIVVVDEAHHFCPEKDEAESMAAVNDLITRGRKRGLCGILATQRLSKLSKDSAAELHNKLIGMAVLDTDVKRAADDLGMSPRDAMPILRSLEPGEFFSFGPALTRTVTKIKVGRVVTTHPEAGTGAALAPPPPSAKIKAILAKLTDLPKEAEQEARTLADLKRENANLKRDLTLARKAPPTAAPVKIKIIEKPVVGKKAITGIREAAKEMNKALRKIREIHAAWSHNLEIVDKRIAGLTATLGHVTNTPNTPMERPASIVPRKAIPAPMLGQASAPTSTPSGDLSLTPMDRAILTVLAQHPEGCTARKLVLLAGYTLNGSARNSFSKLRTAGFITGSNAGVLKITLPGDAAFQDYEPLPPKGTELAHYWLHHKMMTPMDRSILTELINHPEGMAAEPLCVEAGYTLNGSTRNSFSRLRTAGLLVGRNAETMRASEELWT